MGRKICQKKKAYSERNQEPGLIALTQSRHEPRLSGEEAGHSEEPASLVAMLCAKRAVLEIRG